MMAIGGPIQPVDYSGGYRVPDFAAQALQRQELGLRQAQMQKQLREEQRTEDRRAAFEAAFQRAVTTRDPQAYSDLAIQFPEFGEQVRGGFKIQDEAQQRASLTRMGRIHGALTNKRPDIAIQLLKDEIAADIKAKGQADPEDEAALADLESGDETRINNTLGLTETMLHTILGEEKFGGILKTQAESKAEAEKPYTLGPGMIRYGPDGKVISSAPFAPRVLTQSEGQDIVQVNPGSPTGATGATPEFSNLSGGWTPPVSSGGDNKDEVVRNKIGTISKATGFDINGQLSDEQVPAVFDAIAKTEGNPGALPEYNNPTNLRDSPWLQQQPGYLGVGTAGIAKFDTPANGRAAGEKLIRNKMASGQNTLFSLIAGKPGGAAQAGGGGSTQTVSHGKPKQAKATETRTVNGKSYQKINGNWYPVK